MGDFDWVEEVEQLYEYEVYHYLKRNFKVGVFESKSMLFEDTLTFKYLYGMDETFNINSSSKKRVLNKIYWLIEEDFPNVEKSILRRTIRLFLNEIYN